MEAEGDLVGEEAAVDGEDDVIWIDRVGRDEAFQVVSVEGGGGDAVAGAEAELQRLEGAGVVVQSLIGGFDGETSLDGVDVAVGGAEVPEPAAVAV